MSFLKRFPRRETLLPFVLAGSITFCSGYPASVPEVGWLEMDKLGHFAAYGALATAIIRIPGLGRWRGLGLWWALLLASAYGMGDEFRQSLTHGIRSPDWHDWLADTIGATVAVTCYLRWPLYRRLMEWPVLRRRQAPKEGASNKYQGPRTKGQLKGDQ
jgi:VanZ family protein